MCLHCSRLWRSWVNVYMQVKPLHRPCLNTPATKIASASRNCQDVATHCERSLCLNSVISLFAQRAASHLYSQLSPADATTRRKASLYTVRLKRDLFWWVVSNLFPPPYSLRFFSIWLWDRISLYDGISWPWGQTEAGIKMWFLYVPVEQRLALLPKKTCLH